MTDKLAWQRWTVGLTCFALVLPGPVLAEESIEGRAVFARPVQDVRLDPQQGFVGQLVDHEGRPAAQNGLTLWQDGHRVAQSRTDAAGRFSFAGVRPGVYQLTAANTGGIYRLWNATAAPPAATSAALLIQGDVVRGQHGAHPKPGGVYDGAIMKTLSNPWVFTGLLAAGVAIPLALSNNDDDPEGS